MKKLLKTPTTRSALNRREHILRLAHRAAIAVASASLLVTGIAVAPSIAAGSSKHVADTTGIFSDSMIPAVTADPDRVPVELGVAFAPRSTGSVTALQYYQGRRATGVKTAKLWTASGKLLAKTSFSTTTRIGWRTIKLHKPVKLTAGKKYVVSYFAPRGGYPVTERSLTHKQTRNGFTLQAGAGVYRYGTANRVPTKTYKGSNYLVDIVYKSASMPGSVVSPAPVKTTKPTPTKTTTPTPTKTSTPAPRPTPTKTVPSPTPTKSAKPTPTKTTTPTPSSPPSAPVTGTPSAAGCVGAPNTPGGPDPWGGCWPGPQNTGYPQGLAGDDRKPVKLTKYTGPTTIRSCGVVIESKIVSGDLIIEAGHGTDLSKPCVTVRDSLVKGVIFAEKASYGPVLIEDTEVHPSGLSWWENIGRSNFKAVRVNSHGSQGVIKCDSNCVAEDNWVHGMEVGKAYHYNAFGGNGTNNFTIRHNWAACGDWAETESGVQGDAGCSAAIGFYGDFAPIRNITIDKNYLVSTFDTSSKGIYRQAGYCLNPGYYVGKPYPAPSNMSVTNNVFARGGSGKCGVYGPTNSLNKRGAPNGNVWQNNRYTDGAVISRPEE